MLSILKKLKVPKCLLNYIFREFLDLKSIEVILLNVNLGKILNDENIKFFTQAKTGFVSNCMNGNLNVVKYLLQTKSYSSESYLYGLNAAIVKGHFEIIKCLQTEWQFKKSINSINSRLGPRNVMIRENISRRYESKLHSKTICTGLHIF